jgi:hypothetical protein
MHLNEGYLRIIDHFCPKVNHSTLHSPKVISKLYIGYVWLYLVLYISYVGLYINCDIMLYIEYVKLHLGYI